MNSTIYNFNFNYYHNHHKYDYFNHCDYDDYHSTPTNTTIVTNRHCFCCYYY